MPRLTSIHWKKFEKFVLFIGCYFDRQEGDHRIYWRVDLKRPVVFPQDKDIPIFIIRNNLRTLGMSTKEYLALIQKI